MTTKRTSTIEADTTEIGTLLEVSVDTVKTRLHRARLRLRQALADYFGHNGDD